DLWILTLDASGNILSQQIFALPTNSYDIRGIPAQGGGFFLALNVNGYPGTQGNWDVLAMKTDASFNVQWSRLITGNGYDDCVDLKQLSSGEYVICGTTTSNAGDIVNRFGGAKDGYLAEISASGDLNWVKTIGGSWDDEMRGVDETPGGGIAVAGFAWNAQN